ncbi:hypothetical protein [Neomoorella mulderi]|uniref:hypothetical protein n=1 Tax=Neomoorella mulderi TaxID=202604 RepID=UPI001372C9B5|nr:hypothetical protein [Moorella mulderi]
MNHKETGIYKKAGRERSLRIYRRVPEGCGHQPPPQAAGGSRPTADGRKAGWHQRSKNGVMPYHN